MIWLEEKYINLLAHKLLLFKRQKQNLYVFRCPICGDSKKNRSKTRGGFYLPSGSDSYNMGCFNCGASMKFGNFLRLIDPVLYNEYSVEYYKARNDENRIITSESNVVHEIQSTKKRLNLLNLECINDLPESHPAVKYLLKRRIDQSNWSRLYFILRFKKWEAEFRKEKLEKWVVEHPRLIIPFFDRLGNITRLSARSFGNDEPKYIYMKVMDNASRVYGIDTVDAKSKVYVFEGPIDSLFIPNSIAVGSASLIVPELSEYQDYVLVPDNQPRNPEVCKQIRKMVESGSKVCLWPHSMIHKDINEMIMNGYTVNSIKHIIDTNTFSGIQARIMFGAWIRCSI